MGGVPASAPRSGRARADHGRGARRPAASDPRRRSPPCRRRRTGGQLRRAPRGLHLGTWRAAHRHGPARARPAQRGNLRRAWRRHRGAEEPRREAGARRVTVEHLQGDRTMVKYTWDHIHLRTANPEATAQWYERMLGAEVIRTMQQGKPRIDLKLGDGVNPPPLTPYQGLDHFGLTVTGIDAVVAELKAKGVEFTREPTTVRPGVRVAFLRAPQGVSIELLDRNAS